MGYLKKKIVLYLIAITYYKLEFVPGSTVKSQFIFYLQARLH